MAAMRDFELTYAAYAEFQRQMERYWCLRWLRQNQPESVEAKVLRDNLVRLEAIPLVMKVPSLPLQLPGTRVRLEIEGSDLLDVDIRARYLETLGEPDPEEVGDPLFEGS
jgi:exoribonuclease-2